MEKIRDLVIQVFSEKKTLPRMHGVISILSSMLRISSESFNSLGQPLQENFLASVVAHISTDQIYGVNPPLRIA